MKNVFLRLFALAVPVACLLATDAKTWAMPSSLNIWGFGSPSASFAPNPSGTKSLLSNLGEPCAVDVECVNGLFCVDGVCCDSACGGDSPGDCFVCSAAAGAVLDGTCSIVSSMTVCRDSTGICDAEEVCDGASGECPADVAVPGCMDTDFDGLSDSDELLFGTDPNDDDSDGDFLIDGAEPSWNVDTDMDGAINALDMDSDNDGLPDGIEHDSGLTKPLDPDSDDDCLLDGSDSNPILSDYQGICCATDTDCGTITSGRICDVPPRCSDGCRGTNGNGCPAGTECTSVDESPGQCITSSSSASSGTGGGGTGGGSAEGGTGGGGGEGGSGGKTVLTPSGCGCRTEMGNALPNGGFWLLGSLALFVRKRRRRNCVFAQKP